MMFDALAKWGAFKAHISRGLEVSQAMLHIHIGLALYLMIDRVLGHRAGRLAPLQVVTALELANEAMDFARYQTAGWPWKPWGTLGDLINTLLWPLILTLLRGREEKRAD